MRREFGTHVKPSKMGLLGLTALLTLVGCAQKTAPAAQATPDNINIASQGVPHNPSAKSLPGVHFLPPIAPQPGQLGTLAQGIRANIQVFTVTSGVAQGSALGPKYSVVAGSITSNSAHYHANWKTKDTNLSVGDVVRIELRLDNALDDAPACNQGANLKAGCLAFIDAKVWRNRGDANKASKRDPEYLHIVNGKNLPIKFHLAPEAVNVPPQITITSPEEGLTLRADEAFKFVASASDFEDGDLTQSIQWGIQGSDFTASGAGFSKTLPEGKHTITATVQDSGGKTGQASIAVTVVPAYAPPLPPTIIGGSPDGFTGIGGTFTLVMLLEDEEGKAVDEVLSNENFRFKNVQLSSIATPDDVVSSGEAVPVRVENGGEVEQGPVSMMIAIDQSGSMGSNDPQRLRFDAAKQLITTLKSPDEVGVMSLQTVRQGLTTDYALASDAVERVSGGSSDIYGGIRIAAGRLESARHSNKAIVALTDGETPLSNFERSVTEANDAGVNVYTVGLGSKLDFPKLQEVADRTGGAFAHVQDANDLQAVFATIGRSIQQGGTRLTGQVTLDSGITKAGTYLLTGTVETSVRDQTFETPFSVRVYVDGNNVVALPPVLQSITPAEGPTKGGTEVVIKGTDFSRVNKVMFGAVPATSFKLDSASQITTIAPAQGVGEVQVSLIAPEGTSNVATFTYVNQAPSASELTLSTTTPLLGEEVTLSFTASDADGDITNCIVDFGDGERQEIEKCTGTQTLKHTYQAEGDFTVKVTVTDSQGESVSQSAVVKATATPPNAAPVIENFRVSPDAPYAERETTFSFSVSDAEGDNITCIVDFGDGKTQEVTSCAGAQSVTHTYAAEGNYEAVVIAKDASGSVKATMTVQVQPKPLNTAPVIESFTMTPENPKVGEEVTFSFSVSDAEDDDITCTVDFGDGKIQEIENCNSLNSVRHTYWRTEDILLEVNAKDPYTSSKSYSIRLDIDEDVILDSHPSLIDNQSPEIEDYIEILKGVEVYRDYLISFDRDNLLAFKDNSKDFISITISDLQSSDKVKIQYTAAIRDGKVIQYHRYYFDMESKSIKLTNLLTGSVGRVESIDRYLEADGSLNQEGISALEEMMRDAGRNRKLELAKQGFDGALKNYSTNQSLFLSAQNTKNLCRDCSLLVNRAEDAWITYQDNLKEWNLGFGLSAAGVVLGVVSLVSPWGVPLTGVGIGAGLWSVGLAWQSSVSSEGEDLYSKYNEEWSRAQACTAGLFGGEWALSSEGTIGRITQLTPGIGSQHPTWVIRDNQYGANVHSGQGPSFSVLKVGTYGFSGVGKGRAVANIEALAGVKFEDWDAKYDYNLIWASWDASNIAQWNCEQYNLPPNP